MDFIPGEDATICFRVCSSHLSFFFPLSSSSDLLTSCLAFCIFRFLIFPLPLPVVFSSLYNLNHFTGRCTNKCTRSGVARCQCINSTNGPIIQCHPHSQRTMKLTSMGANGFFIAPVHKWDFSPALLGLRHATGLRRDVDRFAREMHLHCVW